jgi:thioredoxin 1
MPALINFKICDNAPECGGIAVCPVKAMTYDKKNKSIVIDNDKCISCGLCVPECPISAIYVAKTEKKYEDIKKEINNDPRTIKDLFVDRYGASPISDFFMITSSQLEEKIKSKELTLIEVYSEELLECLLKSIPIRDITDAIDGDIQYFNLPSSEEIIEKYQIEELPSLLIFKDGKLLEKIGGYYDIDKEEEFKQRVKDIIS